MRLGIPTKLSVGVTKYIDASNFINAQSVFEKKE